MLRPARLLAELTPTRRILCVCATGETTGVGMALSDPYLSNTEETLPPILQGSGSLRRDAIDAAREHDAGALLLAQPMRLPGGVDDATAMQLQQNAATAALPARGSSRGQGGGAHARLLCCLSDRPRASVEALLRWYAEQPEMWEAVQDPLHELQQQWQQRQQRHTQRRLQVCPSMQAAVALNSFLWQHTGGWQNNTFG